MMKENDYEEKVRGNNSDINAATSHGIMVINSPGGNTIAATEHTMGMMMAMARNIAVAIFRMQKAVMAVVATLWNRY